MRERQEFSETFKRQVVSEVLSGQLSKPEARRKYNIKGRSCIINWIRKFEGTATHELMDYSNLDKKELIKRIKELERQLEDEQIRSFGYNKMIDIAEEQLNVPIRKKLGTKQSKK